MLKPTLIEHEQKPLLSYKADELPARSGDEVTNKSRNFGYHYARRYQLFGKYDQGVRIEGDLWAKTIPEHVMSSVATRFVEKLTLPAAPEECSLTILDAFPGCGSSSITLAQQCAKCISVQPILITKKLLENNMQVYECKNIEILTQPFLELPEVLDQQVSAAFLGFEQAYIEILSPEFEAIVDKALSYSSNLALYLPKTTNLPAILEILNKRRSGLVGNQRRDQLSELGIEPLELCVEVEKHSVGGTCKALVLYTGDLAKVNPQQVARHFITKQCYH